MHPFLVVEIWDRPNFEDGYEGEGLKRCKAEGHKYRTIFLHQHHLSTQALSSLIIIMQIEGCIRANQSLSCKIPVACPKLGNFGQFWPIS